MTHTNPNERGEILDRDGYPISVGDLVEFDGIGVYGRVTAVHPYLGRVIVRWFASPQSDSTHPERLTVIISDTVEGWAEAKTEAQKARCGWLTPCPTPQTRRVFTTIMGVDVEVDACVTCDRVMGGPQWDNPKAE